MVTCNALFIALLVVISLGLCIKFIACQDHPSHAHFIAVNNCFVKTDTVSRKLSIWHQLIQLAIYKYNTIGLTNDTKVLLSHFFFFFEWECFGSNSNRFWWVKASACVTPGPEVALSPLSTVPAMMPCFDPSLISSMRWSNSLLWSGLSWYGLDCEHNEAQCIATFSIFFSSEMCLFFHVEENEILVEYTYSFLRWYFNTAQLRFYHCPL